MGDKMKPTIKGTYGPLFKKADIYLEKLKQGQESKNLVQFML